MSDDNLVGNITDQYILPALQAIAPYAFGAGTHWLAGKALEKLTGRRRLGLLMALIGAGQALGYDKKMREEGLSDESLGRMAAELGQRLLGSSLGVGAGATALNILDYLFPKHPREVEYV